MTAWWCGCGLHYHHLEVVMELLFLLLLNHLNELVLLLHELLCSCFCLSCCAI